MILFEVVLLCFFASSFSITIIISWVISVSYHDQKFGERGLSHGHSAFPSGSATYMQRAIKKVREGEREKEDGKLHHTKWKANNMHISILRRCTTLLGKTKTKELSDTTVQSILHLSKRLSSSIEMHHSKRKKGNSSKVTQKQQTTLSPSFQPTPPSESHLTQC